MNGGAETETVMGMEMAMAMASGDGHNASHGGFGVRKLHFLIFGHHKM